MKSKRQRSRPSLSKAKLDEMIEEATVDAYGDSEQIMGFFNLFEERLQLPFKAEVLGIEVSDRQSRRPRSSTFTFSGNGRPRKWLGRSA